ncbi:GAF domain-containing protein [Alicyclobacillus acidiphilus]|uniref:GAF domain-containing protein n=1 Tax=Alicyclobacillus acidiphilus TaxID=182455 RepID=UPI00082BDE83|nr:GAF domain-containing protein [Alicyclobacillus acidiphilus]
MYSETKLEATDLERWYQELAKQLDHLLAGEANAVANLSNMSALLGLHLQDINWVGFYLWNADDGELVLGPFQGKPACIRIGLGKGVCGTAAQRRETVIVPDVLAFPGHIACDPASRSEIVVPMVAQDRLIGVLDIDSPQPNRFGEADKAGLERLVQVLLKHTTFA